MQDNLKLPYEVQIPTSQWAREGRVTTTMELSQLLKTTMDSAGTLKKQRDFLSVTVVLLALAAGLYYTLAAGSTPEPSPNMILQLNANPSLPWVWEGQTAPTLAQIEILSGNLRNTLANKSSVSLVEEIAQTTLVGVVLPQVKQLLIQRQEAEESKKVIGYTVDPDNAAIAFQQELVKNCEQENCHHLDNRKHILEEMIRKNGVPNYSQEVKPKCEEDPSNCLGMAKMLWSLKKLFRDTAMTSPSADLPTMVAANNLALGLETALLDLLPVHEQVDYSSSSD